MSHHYSGPDFGFPRGDARLDLTDLYAFPKPGDAGKSILIMNVHPSAVVNPPGLTTASRSRPRRCTNSRLTRTAMPSPTSHTGCASRLPGTGRKPRRCGARGRAGRRDGRRRSGYRRSGTGLNWSGCTRDGGRRLSLLRGLAQRSLLLRHAGRPEQPAVHRRRLLRRQECVQHRAGSAQLCAWTWTG